MMYETLEQKERFILVAVSLGEPEKTRESLDELEELINTAGGEAVGRVIQNLEQIQGGTYVGRGKIEEIREELGRLKADGIVCDDELTPIQMKNLEEELDTRIMDRTLIILDIFAKRAATREGRIQVELAQLRYRATRLIGVKNFSRLGGGIGTRGPGEKKLEQDRRLIKERISRLRGDIREMERHREVARSAREQNGVPVAAIVGYTNAGKSTLLNAMSGSSVLEEDKLFATLDPTARACRLPSGQTVILMDTVGFIRKLPHDLIDAFRSTLEEAKYADILIHVADASCPEIAEKTQVVYDTLRELGVMDKPIITVFNKIDLLSEPTTFRDFSAEISLTASLKNGVGLEELSQALSDVIKKQNIYVEKTFPYAMAAEAEQVRRLGQVRKEEYRPDGIYMEAYVPASLLSRLKS